MKAQPLFGDVYVRWREADFGRIALPGAHVLTVSRPSREFKSIAQALDYIKQLHDQRLKGT